MTGIVFEGKTIPAEVVRHCAEYIRKRKSPVIVSPIDLTGGSPVFFARRSLSQVRDSEKVVALMAETRNIVSQLKESMS